MLLFRNPKSKIQNRPSAVVVFLRLKGNRMNCWRRRGLACFIAVLCLVSRGMADDRVPLIETIAGTGQPADGGDGGPALKTNVGDPFGVEIRPGGGALHHGSAQPSSAAARSENQRAHYRRRQRDQGV